MPFEAPFEMLEILAVVGIAMAIGLVALFLYVGMSAFFCFLKKIAGAKTPQEKNRLSK